MCGIVGISCSGRNLNMENLISPMIRKIAQRGPDSQGFFVSDDGNSSLGHTRLSIIDTSNAANQPMNDSTGRYVIVFNGEIYNFKEVKRKVENEKKIPWQTTGDTEVLLEAFVLWGEAAFEHIGGDFAFALYDKKEKKLILGRDRIGVKPLYYYFKDGVLAFGSETKALLALDNIDKSMDSDSLGNYFFYGSFLSPGTPFNHIKMLEPAHYLVFQNGKLDKKCFWNVDWSDKYQLSRGEVVKNIQEKFYKSVESRLVSDVPLGLFLSGGIDSGSILSAAKEAKSDIDSFSIVYDEAEYSEKYYIDLLVKKFAPKHHEIRLGYNDFLSIFSDFEKSVDLPSADGLNTFFISRYTKKAGITVALSGLGGDELFAGYGSFYEVDKWNKFIKYTPHAARAAAGSLLKYGHKEYRLKKLGEILMKTHTLGDFIAMRRMLFNQQEKKNLLGRIPNLFLGKDSLPGFSNISSPIDQNMAFEIRRYMHDTLLRDSDVMSLANALELRVPFLDKELIEVMARVPSEMRINLQKPKNLLVDALKNPLPDEVIYRKKMGFVLPLEVWFRKKEIVSEVDKIFSYNSQYINQNEAGKCWTMFKSESKEIPFGKIFALFSFLLWEKQLKGD